MSKLGILELCKRVSETWSGLELPKYHVYNWVGIYNGVFGKRSYHAKYVPSLLSATLLAGNGISHAINDL